MKYQWIGGKWHKPKREPISIIDPATEEILDQIPSGTTEDANLAVKSARSAFNQWRWIPSSEKAVLLHEIVRRLRNLKKDSFMSLR